MNALTGELAAVASELVAAGVPATHDPALILQLVARQSVAAMVAPPELLRLSLGMAAVDLDVRVWLITAGKQDDLPAIDRLYGAALLAWPVAVPLEQVERDTYTSGETLLPALRWDTARRVTYPVGSSRHGS